ncbi:MAG: hypothetical protein M3Q31_13450, partial [Actinomycetota bacterium]|nr:hypothetical protein [Actinomycetota bacterium]
MIRDGRQITEHDAVRHALEELGTGAQREARLAGPARPGESHQTLTLVNEETDDRGDLLLASDQRTVQRRDVHEARGQRAKRREISLQTTARELVDA